ncbi:MAG: periplasmic heavy metal sensor [Acidobacteria bacterium]|nr:periplasmic heavy metal sensor [Acidobacteriota bacterium]
MTKVFRRMTLGFGAAAIAVLVAGAGYQHLSAQGPGPGGPGPRAGRGDFGPGPGGPMGRRGGPGGPGGPLGLGPMMLGRLDLTNDQRDRVKQILDSHRDDQKAIGDRAMKAHQALQEAITGTFDEGGIRARAADVAAVDADMAVLQGRIYSEVYQILTPEQQTKLKQQQAELKQRQGQRPNDAGPRGRGGRGQR